jgi:hypothetical protein
MIRTRTSPVAGRRTGEALDYSTALSPIGLRPLASSCVKSSTQLKYDRLG